MKQDKSWPVQRARDQVSITYGVLLERGYEVLSGEDIPMGWQVVLGKQDLLVRLFSIRGEEDVSFRVSTQPTDEYFDLGSVVYAATGEIMPLADTYSRELRRYLGRIEAYFEEEYGKNPDSLRVAESEYRQTLPRLGVVSPQEPKIIPILYYPLKWIIMLLIFGALTTLYAVLLDSLSSAFSINSEVFSLFTRVVALVLGIATMLGIRKRIG